MIIHVLSGLNKGKGWRPTRGSKVVSTIIQMEARKPTNSTTAKNTSSNHLYVALQLGRDVLSLVLSLNDDGEQRCEGIELELLINLRETSWNMFWCLKCFNVFQTLKLI